MTHVRSVRLSGVMSYTRDACVALPERGVVIVTGENGAGKSSIIEAVSVGCWGKSLRGTSVWRDGEAGEIDVTTSTHAIRRKRSAKGKSAVAFVEHNGADSTAYDTQTKAQDALACIVGSWDVWRRTSVFSSQDAQSFTLATDAERKRLLETILGLDRFDDAAEACRADLRQSQTRHTANAHKLHEEQRVVTERHMRVLDGEETRRKLGPVENIAALATRRAEVRAAKQSATDEIAALNQRMSAVLHSEVDARTDARTLEFAHREAMKRAATHTDNCAMCGTPLADAAHTRAEIDAEIARAADAAARARVRADAAVQAVAGERARLKAQLDELTEECNTANGMEGQLSVKMQAAEHNNRQRADLDASLMRMRDAVSSSQTLIEACELSMRTFGQAVAELTACDRVLSLTGVRAHMLNDALSGIEQIANSWLQRIAGLGIRLELRPYAEKAAGGVRDAISLVVHGAGGGHGYAGASGGQRRRIDVALLLALSEVAAAAHGTTPGTLFFDEVFDALDTAGVAAVCEVLGELAADRAVVVITHNAEVASGRHGFAPGDVVARWHVAGGRIDAA
jgi:DNA repair exonuclease SbcCD ATPase subunit